MVIFSSLSENSEQCVIQLANQEKKKKFWVYAQTGFKYHNVNLYAHSLLLKAVHIHFSTQRGSPQAFKLMLRS